MDGRRFLDPIAPDGHDELRLVALDHDDTSDLWKIAQGLPDAGIQPSAGRFVRQDDGCAHRVRVSQAVIGAASYNSPTRVTLVAARLRARS